MKKELQLRHQILESKFNFKDQILKQFSLGKFNRDQVLLNQMVLKLIKSILI